MTVISMSSATIRQRPREGILIKTWENLANGDTGEPLESCWFSDKTIQVFGTFGSGGSVTMQGSNDPRVLTNAASAEWFSLVDPQGNAITKTASGGEAILENPRFIRPSVTAGDATTALTVIICARG